MLNNFGDIIKKKKKNIQMQINMVKMQETHHIFVEK